MSDTFLSSVASFSTVNSALSPPSSLVNGRLKLAALESFEFCSASLPLVSLLEELSSVIPFTRSLSVSLVSNGNPATSVWPSGATTFTMNLGLPGLEFDVVGVATLLSQPSFIPESQSESFDSMIISGISVASILCLILPSVELLL